MVPGSTLMYGSNFWIVTRRPRSTSRRPSDAAAMPLPRDDTTPPVTKMYFVELTDSPPSVGGSPVFRRTAGRLPCRRLAPRARGTARHRSEDPQQRPQLLEPLPPL